MEALEVVAALVFVVGVVMIATASRSKTPAPSAARIASVERKLDLIMKHLGIVEPRPDFPDIVQELMQGRKIQAIKLYRERTGVGLKEAKDAVEQMGRERGIEA